VGGDRDTKNTPSTSGTFVPIPLPPIGIFKTTRLLCPRRCPLLRTISEDRHPSKQRRTSRSAITNTAPVKHLVRPRPGSPAREHQDDSRPTKRTRKAINCAPCRTGKLKCVRTRPGGVFLILANRNRPSSSCVLRGESLHLVGSAVKAYFSTNDMQTRSRCAIKEQMANPSPAMMREFSSSPDVFPVYKRLEKG
jgi:hypothetical protein